MIAVSVRTDSFYAAAIHNLCRLKVRMPIDITIVVVVLEPGTWLLEPGYPDSILVNK